MEGLAGGAPTTGAGLVRAAARVRGAPHAPLRFYVEGERYILALRVTGVPGGTVELERQGDELRVRLGRFRRTLALPQYLAGLDPAWAQVEGEYLKVAFEQA